MCEYRRNMSFPEEKTKIITQAGSANKQDEEEREKKKGTHCFFSMLFLIQHSIFVRLVSTFLRYFGFSFLSYFYFREQSQRQQVIGNPAAGHLPAGLAGPRHLAIYARNHWAIENREHYVRDVTFREDAQKARTGSQPNAHAGIRNLVMGACRRKGHANIAAARRYYGRDDQRILALYGYL